MKDVNDWRNAPLETLDAAYVRATARWREINTVAARRTHDEEVMKALALNYAAAPKPGRSSGRT